MHGSAPIADLVGNRRGMKNAQALIAGGTSFLNAYLGHMGSSQFDALIQDNGYPKPADYLKGEHRDGNAATVGEKTPPGGCQAHLSGRWTSPRHILRELGIDETFPTDGVAYKLP